MKKTLLGLILLAAFTLLCAQNQPLVVTSPNGGEIWTRGSSYNITWTQTNLTGNVVILLLGQDPPAPTVVFIAQGIPVQNCQYNWQIPGTIPAAATYRIRISMQVSPAENIMDFSDAYFTISEGTNPPPGSLILTAPNGGEQWQIGSTQQITWTTPILTGNCRLLLMGPVTRVIAQEIPVSTGAFTWAIPADIAPGIHYRVKVYLLPESNAIFDISDADFAITPVNPPNYSVTVLSPNGGEQWAQGSMQTITWTHTGFEGEVTIGLIPENSNNQIIIAQSVPAGAHTFTWTVPATLAPGSYRVHIMWLTILTIYVGDLSDEPFQITGTTPPEPFIHVNSPNGGETWVAGTMHPIMWNTNLTEGMAMIQLLGGPEASPVVIIANVPVAQGIFEWMIPVYQMPLSSYQVQIGLMDPAGTFLGDISDGTFTIVAGGENPHTITVVSPNGGEVWSAGSSYPITWSYTNLEGNVYIGLIGMNTNMINIICQSVPVTAQSWQWTIPATFIPGMYRVQIVWISPLDIYVGDFSNEPFQITNETPPPPQDLNLTSPNGGEQWMIGETYPITWTTTLTEGMVNLMLVGANEPGSMTVVICPGVPVAALSFAWTIPNFVVPGTNYRVMISFISADGVLHQDYSDEPFTIVLNQNPPPDMFMVTAPNGGEQWTKGTTQNITWNDSEYTGNVRIMLTFGNSIHLRRLIITRNAPNTGTYAWLIPMRLPVGSFYRVVVKKVGGAMDISNAPFSIVAPTASLKASPNPTHAGTRISFSLQAPISSSIRIYNIKGQCVRTLVQDQTLSGSQTIWWDGLDNHGSKVSAGIYFARIETSEFNSSQRIIVLK
jgi:hypothetical protein